MRTKRRIAVSMLVFSLIVFQFYAIKVEAKTGEVAGIEETTAYYIKNVASGLYLEYNPGNDNVRVGNFTGSQNQRWGFRLKTNGNYVIVPRGNTLYRLDVHSGTGAQNANNAGNSSGSYNLVDEIYSKGAKFVLAPTVITYVQDNAKWIEAFLKASSEKKTVAQAMAVADVISPNSSHYYYKGNSYQKLYP